MADDAVPDPEPGDELPEDLDVTAYVGPYVFPDIRRRRIAAACYAVIGAASLWAGIAADNRGLLLGGASVAAYPTTKTSADNAAAKYNIATAPERRFAMTPLFHE